MNEELKETMTIVIKSLIKEIEGQGNTSVTTTQLREFIHNIKTDTTVIGKKYVSEKGLGR